MLRLETDRMTSNHWYLMNIITNWLRRQFANPQLVVLILILAAVVLTLYLAGDSLAPVLAATVIAYLLQGLVNRLDWENTEPRSHREIQTGSPFNYPTD